MRDNYVIRYVSQLRSWDIYKVDREGQHARVVVSGITEIQAMEIVAELNYAFECGLSNGLRYWPF